MSAYTGLNNDVPPPPGVGWCGPASHAPWPVCAFARISVTRVVPGSTGAYRDQPAGHAAAGGKAAIVTGRFNARGLLVIGCCVILTATGCAFQGVNSLPLPGAVGRGPGASIYHVEIANVSHLEPNSPVMIDDVVVGSVGRITVKGWHAEVEVSVKPDVVVPDNAVAKVGQTSLLGSMHMELNPPLGQAPRGRLKPGATIPLDKSSTYPSTEQTLALLSVVINSGGLAQIGDIIHNVNAVLSGREGQIRDLLTRLDTFVGTLDQQRDNIIASIQGLNRLADTFAGQRDVITQALRRLPPALEVLIKERPRITEALDKTACFRRHRHEACQRHPGRPREKPAEPGADDPCAGRHRTGSRHRHRVHADPLPVQPKPDRPSRQGGLHKPVRRCRFHDSPTQANTLPGHPLGSTACAAGAGAGGTVLPGVHLRSTRSWRGFPAAGRSSAAGRRAAAARRRHRQPMPAPRHKRVAVPSSDWTTGRPLMLTRFIKVQLTIFTIVGTIAVLPMVFDYMRAPSLLGVGRMTITLKLPAAGGLYRFSNVTYRGVQVGEVAALKLTPNDAEATLSLGTSLKSRRTSKRRCAASPRWANSTWI